MTSDLAELLAAAAILATPPPRELPAQNQTSGQPAAPTQDPALAAYPDQ